MKHIAFVTDKMSAGGVEQALVQIFNSIDYKKYKVDLWLQSLDGEFQDRINDNVTVKKWYNESPKKLLFTQLKSFKLISFVKGMFFRILAHLNVNEWNLNAFYSARCLPPQKYKYDCVICYQGLNPRNIAIARYYLRGSKYILWFHGRNIRPKKLNDFFDRVYSKFDLIYYVSEASRQENIIDFPKSASKTQVFYNLLNYDEIIKKSNESLQNFIDKHFICTVGRLETVKGQRLIPKTARMLIDAGYNIKWYLVGDGADRAEVERLIDFYGLGENVILLGTQLNPYPYIKNCDIYVQPSFSEGYCTTTVEAKMLKKPVVTTDAPGMSEQFTHMENGYIVDAMTSEALFEGIKYLIEHPDLQKKLVENLSNENWDNNELQKLYDFIEG